MSTTRRTFLKTSLSAAAFASLGTSASAFAAPTGGRRDTKDTVLVIVELAGGNDGLNTVVPFENDVYGRSRTTLRMAKKDVLKINDELGFHPAVEGFRRLFDEGHLSIVQGVGYPKPNGGHDQAVLDWHSAQPHGTNRQAGWMGPRPRRECDARLDHRSSRGRRPERPAVLHERPEHDRTDNQYRERLHATAGRHEQSPCRPPPSPGRDRRDPPKGYR